MCAFSQCNFHRTDWGNRGTNVTKPIKSLDYNDIVEVTRCLSRRWDIFVSFILACWTCLITAKKSQSFTKTDAGL